jgi:hypothetical protein
MAARESEPLVESLRIDARLVRQKFHQLATVRTRFRNRPLHQLLADAAAAQMAGDADILQQAARGALRTQSRQDAELQAADDRTLAVFGNHEPEIRIACDAFERIEIDLRQRIFEPFPRSAEPIIRQHGDNVADIVAAGATDGDR